MEPQVKKRFDPRPYAIGIVVIHLALNIAHGVAHAQLEIGLDAFQKLFVSLVILAAPLYAGYLLWKGRLRTGGWLLAISMAGALAFGVYFHFILPGPDNVNQPDLSAPLRSRQLFEETATDLALTEGLGVVAGLTLLLQSSTPKIKAAASMDGRHSQ